MKQHWAYYLGIFLFIIFISIPLIFPYFYSGYFTTHDGEWAVVRLTDMFRELKDHQFPPRYSGNLNFGYGYPLFNFAYPFPYYLGIFFHFFNIGFVDSIKTLFALSVPFSAMGMFLAASTYWKNTWAGIISALLYSYYPYRVIDLYVRGSIGESLAFVLFPFIIYFGIKIVEGGNAFRYVSLAAFSFSALIMTHNIMTVLFLPVIFIFFSLFIYRNKKKALFFLYSVIIGILLSSFFWMPALLEKNLILLSETPIANRSLYFVKAQQLIFPKYGYGQPTNSDGFGYQIGIGHLISFLVVIAALFYVYKKNKHNNKNYTSAVIISMTILIMVFLMFKESAFLWKLPLLSEINYPWTILGPLGFFLSFLIGYITVSLPYGRNIGIMLAAGAIILLLPYAKPQTYIDREDMYYLTNDATTTSSKELMPLWVKKMPDIRPKEKVEVKSGNAIVANVLHNSRFISFYVKARKESILKVNTIYYPGWHASINNTNIPISYTNDQGVMELLIPSGNFNVNVIFSETPLRRVGNTISLVSFFILTITFLTSFRKKYAA